MAKVTIPRGRKRVQMACRRKFKDLRDFANGFQDAFDVLEQEIEVVRVCWELRLGGHGPTEIAYRLKSGPPWMRRTVRQVQSILQPSKWALAGDGTTKTEDGRGA